MKKQVVRSFNALKAQAAAALVGFGALAAGAVSAQTGPDVSAVVSTIATVVTAAAAIGVAVLSMTAGVKLYKWIKAAM